MRKSLAAGIVAGLALIPQAPVHAVCVAVDGGGVGVTTGACDEINQLTVDYLDPISCVALAALGQSGVDASGVLEINDQGDVFVLGSPFWDCPPYDLFPSAVAAQ